MKKCVSVPAFAYVCRSLQDAEKGQQGWEAVVRELRQKVAQAIEVARATASKLDAQREVMSTKERLAKEAQLAVTERTLELAALKRELSDLRDSLETISAPPHHSLRNCA